MVVNVPQLTPTRKLVVMAHAGSRTAFDPQLTPTRKLVVGCRNILRTSGQTFTFREPHPRPAVASLQITSFRRNSICTNSREPPSIFMPTTGSRNKRSVNCVPDMAGRLMPEGIFRVCLRSRSRNPAPSVTRADLQQEKPPLGGRAYCTAPFGALKSAISFSMPTTERFRAAFLSALSSWPQAIHLKSVCFGRFLGSICPHLAHRWEV